MGIIYLITNTVNGKRYVGQTSKDDPSTRWNQHRSGARTPKHPIARSIKKHGPDAFRFEILERVDNASLDAREMHWIKELGTLTPVGYNMTEGGNTSPRAPIVGRRISAANKGRVKDEEWRRKLSESHKAMRKVISAEQRAHNSLLHRGVPETPESNLKRSLALKGRPRLPHPSDEARNAKIAATLTGRKLSPESIAKRTAKQTGLKRSPETRERMRIAHLAVVARKREASALKAE